MIYETLKSLLKKYVNPEPTTPQLLASGGIAGTLAQTVTYPLDVLRRKMQMQGFSEKYPVYGSTWNCIKYTYNKESVRGFYRGLLPNYLKVVPAISISFVTYEEVKRFIRA
jgi:solute carrier family 25 phosphate transporter 23/24/25/41